MWYGDSNVWFAVGHIGSAVIVSITMLLIARMFVVAIKQARYNSGL